MKLSRNELKSIVKECIVEILTEGLGHDVQLSETVSRRNHVNNVPKRNIPERRAQQPKMPPALNHAVAIAASGNNIMADIFADTAKTTLQSQLNADDHRTSMLEGADRETRIVNQTTPEDIFGSETLDKWSALAFDTPLQRRN